MPVIIPFLIGDTWFGLSLDNVKGVESCGKIALIPNAKKPLIGLMHKNGKIIPVWSIVPALIDLNSDVQKRLYYLDLIINGEQAVLPVDSVQSVTSISQGWVSGDVFGMKLYRSLDKNPIFHAKKNVTEVTVLDNEENMFYKETPFSSFPVIEEI